MKKIGELYLGSRGKVAGRGSKPPEYPGFADPTGFSNMLSDNLFKFAKLDQIPDEHVDAILMELKLESTDTS